MHFTHSMSLHLKPLAPNVNERQLIKFLPFHLEIDGCVWRPGGRSAVLFMPAYLCLIGHVPFDPALQKSGRQDARFHSALIVCFVVCAQKHLHSARWKTTRLTYICPPVLYSVYTLQSDTQDIFAQVTSGNSYHLFTACTPF